MEITIKPSGQLDLLSHHETALLEKSSQKFNVPIADLFRKCALAVLSCGSAHDDSQALFEQHKDFEIQVYRSSRGILLKLINPPKEAFVEDELIQGIEDHLLSVLRDIVFMEHQVPTWERNGESTTDIVFNILRNSGVLQARKKPNMVVCYRLGLRLMDICTGCGTGAMKGPMKGAMIAHGKQRKLDGRYIGITEPGIIASEAPNAIVNGLIIMPDIEKRLEAFVRLGHGIIVFPGGVGTCEEILYLLGILLHPKNKHIKVPLILTGPKEAAAYFESLDEFIQTTLGKEAQNLYEIIIDNPIQVARTMKSKLDEVETSRRENEDAFHYNWLLTIDEDFQTPFEPSHENMANLNLYKDQATEQLASNLRRAFSGIVAGNVKEDFVNKIELLGQYKLTGDREVMDKLDVKGATCFRT